MRYRLRQWSKEQTDAPAGNRTRATSLGNLYTNHCTTGALSQIELIEQRYMINSRVVYMYETKVLAQTGNRTRISCLEGMNTNRCTICACHNDNPGGTRTRSLLIRSQTPYPLGHGVTRLPPPGIEPGTFRSSV